MGSVFISFVVPCYNIEKYVQRCLDSLARQSLSSDYEIEFILVNDGSTDGTLRVLEEIAASDNRAIVVNQVNQGVSAARNNGLKAAHGEYVFFLDADDFLTDDASQIIYDLSCAQKPEIVICNAYIVKEDNLEHKKEWNVCSGITDDVFEKYDFIKNVKQLPISFKAYRREFLIKNNILYDEELKVGEVYTFFLHALAYAEKVAFSQKRIMNYLIRGGSVMRQFNLERDALILRTIDIIDDYRKLFDGDIRNYVSYNAAFFSIVNKFSIKKYVKATPYTPQIGRLLKAIKNRPPFKDVLHFLVYKNRKANRNFFISSLFLFFPVRASYAIMRIGMKFRLFNCTK